MYPSLTIGGSFMKISIINASAFSFFGALFFLTPAQASKLADDVIGNLYTMRSVYQAEYAPAAWKKSYAGYDLDTEFAKAVAAVQAKPDLTLKDSREILKQFIYAMKDYHTSISFVSTESASLPFTIRGTGDHEFIVYIDRSKLPEATFPFHVGDELVSVDGKSAAQAVSDVQAEIPANVPETDRAIAELYFTTRPASRGYNVPKGPVTLGIKSAGSDVVSNYQMIWDYVPERIQVRTDLSGQKSLADDVGVADASIKQKSSLFHPQMSVNIGGSAANSFDLGARKTFTPDLGSVKVWQSADSDNFNAYIYKTEDRRLIGYVRIPQYEADDLAKAAAEFSRDIALFESTTDAMVIDQANNPGGSVFYLYALASMLSAQPLDTPLHRMAITQADVQEALKTITDLSAVKNDDDAKKANGSDNNDGYPVSYEFAQFTLNYARFIVSEWNAGRKLTNPYWIAGVDRINPGASHYTKPILLLTNHLDFSGGDFFPAIMQDNKRVTIMGTRTAGAGGYVNSITVPNNIGVNAFRCTESIAERVSQNPIENLGVKPDVDYEITAADLTGGFADYVKAINAQVNKLTGGK